MQQFLLPELRSLSPSSLLPEPDHVTFLDSLVPTAPLTATTLPGIGADTLTAPAAPAELLVLVLELLPNTAMGGAAAWLCFAGVYAVCLMVCYALYTLFVRRYEQRFA